MPPLVSVIMPAYNAENFLSDSINSVLAQTFRNWELIITDDGSIDNTKAVIESFCTKDVRIKYLYQENGGQGKARNLGLSTSKGKYIAFLDADDFWLPEKLEVQIKQLEENKVDLVFSDCWVFNNTISDSTHTLDAAKGIFQGDTALVFFLEKNGIPTLTVLIKADVLNTIKGFSEKRSIQNAEDYHLWLRLLINGYIFYGSELILAGYREHLHSATHTDKFAISKVVEALMDLKDKHRSHGPVINTYLKRWFKKYHYLSNNWDLVTYKDLIKRNCSYTNNSRYNFIFQMSLQVFGLKVTRKLLNRIVNG